MDFLLTEKGQEMITKFGGWLPVRSDSGFKFPDGRTSAEIKVVPLDLAYVTPAQREENVRKFHEIMR